MKRTPLHRKTGLSRDTSRPLSRSKGLSRGNGQGAGLSREKGLGRGKPKAARLQKAPKRWRDAMGDRCASCRMTRAEVGRTGRRLVQHHVFYAQHVENAGGDVWDPRNSLTVCGGGPVGCHELHHGRSCPIRLADLPDSVYEFGREVFGGPAAYEYLARRYAVGDPRLDELLAEV